MMRPAFDLRHRRRAARAARTDPDRLFLELLDAWKAWQELRDGEASRLVERAARRRLRRAQLQLQDAADEQLRQLADVQHAVP